jgi:HEPN domain-containing protein
MTTPLQQLEEQLREIDNDPGVRTFRSLNKRRRPDLSNRSDTDVLEWLQRAEENSREFFDEYSNHPSSRAYEEYAEEIVDCAKRLITAIQDAQGRHEEIG